MIDISLPEAETIVNPQLEAVKRALDELTANHENSLLESLEAVE